MLGGGGDVKFIGCIFARVLGIIYELLRNVYKLYFWIGLWNVYEDLMNL